MVPQGSGRGGGGGALREKGVIGGNLLIIGN